MHIFVLYTVFTCRYEAHAAILYVNIVIILIKYFRTWTCVEHMLG